MSKWGDTWCVSSPRFLRLVLRPLSGIAEPSICRSLGRLGSGVSWVYLFGTEVVHDHSVGVSCKCTAGEENDSGVRLPLREDPLLTWKRRLTQEPSQKKPTLTTRGSLLRGSLDLHSHHLCQITEQDGVQAVRARRDISCSVSAVKHGADGAVHQPASALLPESRRCSSEQASANSNTGQPVTSL